MKKLLLKISQYLQATVLESFFRNDFFVKKRLQDRCFFVNIAENLRTSILKNICERLLLKLTLKYQAIYRISIG